MTTTSPPPQGAELTTGQRVILIAAAVPMAVFAALGAWGTYSNIVGIFHRSATAWGVVAAGEGATLSLALVYVGLTLLGQSSPTVVRIGLWLLPAAASSTGAIVAPTTTQAVVFAVTPMAMCSSAEGLGLLARRIVIRVTGVDREAQRRNAKTMQQIAYHRARAANHPDPKAQEKSALKSWRLARRVGAGDVTLGADLVKVQRARMTDGADAALAAMFTPAAVAPALPGSVTPALPGGSQRDGSGTAPVTEFAPRDDIDTADTKGVTDPGTQVSDGPHEDPSRPAADAVPKGDTGEKDQTVTDGVPDEPRSVTDEEPSRESAHPVTLAEIAAVAGVPVPVTGERLTDGQLDVVLRHLRYTDDPPLSYRQAVGSFREAGFVGSEERVRRVWGALMSNEETSDPGETEGAEASKASEDAGEADEEPEDAGA